MKNRGWFFMDVTKKWHVSSWSLLAWIETGLKIIAFGFAAAFILPA
jgi:hypothetical protein